MSINQRLYIIYFFLIFMLHYLHDRQVNAAIIYNNNNLDYMDAIDKGLSSVQESNDIAAERADIEMQDMNYIPERVMHRSTQEMEKEVTAMPLEQSNSQSPVAENRQQEVRAACGPPPPAEPPMDCRPEEPNPCPKDPQDTIDHVALLIKQMREHSIALIKNINELEMDLLATCEPTPEPCPTPEPECNTNSNDFDGYNNNADNNNGNNNENKLNENNSNNNDKKYGENGNELNGNSAEANGENSNNSGTKGQSASSNPVVMNEWAATVKNDDTQSQTSRDFMAEAQEAVRAWKSQIEACKQILDNAVAQAAQNSVRNQYPNYVYKPLQSQQLTNQQQQQQQMQNAQMAPAAAASLTPVAPQHMHANATSSFKDTKPTLSKSNDLISKLKKLKSDTRMRKYNAKYDPTHAKGLSNGWGLF